MTIIVEVQDNAKLNIVMIALRETSQLELNYRNPFVIQDVLTPTE